MSAVTSVLAATLRLGLGYAPWLIGQLLLSTLRLAADVGTPGSTQRPRIVKLTLGDLTDVEVAVLTSSITITPGTLVLGIAAATADAPRATFVQGLFGEDEAALMEELEDMRERVVRAFRGRDRARKSQSARGEDRP